MSDNQNPTPEHRLGSPSTPGFDPGLVLAQGAAVDIDTATEDRRPNGQKLTRFLAVVGLSTIAACSGGSGESIDTIAVDTIAPAPTVTGTIDEGTLAAEGTIPGSSSTSTAATTTEVVTTEVPVVTEAPTTTISPEQQALIDLGEGVSSQETRYAEDLAPNVEYSKGVWAYTAGLTQATINDAGRLPDWKGGLDWPAEKAAIIARATELLQPAVRAIGDSQQEGYPDVAGLLNTVPAEMPADLQAIGDAIDSDDVDAATKLYEGLVGKLDALESILFYKGQESEDQTEEAEAEGQPKPVEEMSLNELRKHSAGVLEQYDAAVAADIARQQREEQARQQANSGGSSSSGGGSSSGGSSGGGSGSSSGGSSSGGSSGGGSGSSSGGSSSGGSSSGGSSGGSSSGGSSSGGGIPCDPETGVGC